MGGVDRTHFNGELLLQPWGELVRVGAGVLRVRVKTATRVKKTRLLERDVGSISALLSTKVHGDHALVVSVKFEIHVLQTVGDFLLWKYDLIMGVLI